MARAFEPGVQADHCLVLEGDQGLGKSTLFRLLGGDWYDGTPPRFDTKDAMLSFRGVWIRELSELAGTSRTEFATIKAILTERVDRFRPPYGRHMVEIPRRCVFCASVNPGEDYVRDATGGRRFWPIKVTDIKLHQFAKDRDALLAEALQAYRDGEVFHPPQLTEDTRELVTAIKDTQGARQVSDPWTERVLGSADTEPTTEQLLGLLAIPFEHRDQRAAGRVARIMRAAGYELKRRRNKLVSGADDKHPGNNQVYRWVKQ
jgi:predicted P-loop ATPase